VEPPTPPFSGDGVGFYLVGPNPGICPTLAAPDIDCTISPIVPPTPNAVSMVLVENGQALSLWYAFSEAPAASDFVGKIWYTWYDPTTCEEVGEGSSSVSEAIPNNNC